MVKADRLDDCHEHDPALKAARTKYFRRLKRFHRSIGLPSGPHVAVTYFRMDTWELLREAQAKLDATLADPAAIERARASVAKTFSR